MLPPFSGSKPGGRRCFVLPLTWWLLMGLPCLLAGPAAAQALPTAAAPADTLAPVPEALVRYYLARSLSVPALAHPTSTMAQRTKLLDWAATAGMRLAGRLSGWFYTPESDAAFQVLIDTLRRNIGLLHARQPEAVAQGCIFEILWPHVSNLTVPNRLRVEFGEDTLAEPSRHFRFADMMYPEYSAASNARNYRWDARPPGQAPGTPDLSRPEAQLWFYYCAVRQLDAGCEALHFGQIELMDDQDPGHRATWSLLQRVRRYARTRNRGFVLCDAHTHGAYYDPRPAAPLPDSLRQLLFDFHSYPLRPNEADTVRTSPQAAHLDPDAGAHIPTGAIFGRSQGGRAPGGWLCHHLPAQAEFDNGPSGTPDRPGQWPLVWGRDEISWYGHQPSAYRSRWLVYAQARVRQLDPAAYFQPAGARGVSLAEYPAGLYWATEAGQAETIRAVWAGETTAEGARLLLIGPPAP